MATIYLKLVANYRVVEDPEDDPEDPSESVKLQFQKKGASEAELIMLVQGEPPQRVRFALSKENLKSGTFEIGLIEDSINVEIDGIFKIAVRSHFAEEVLNSSNKWYCEGVEGIFGIPRGLEEERYPYKDRSGEGERVRYLIPVKTGTNVKSLAD